jgi:hypothetical protein
VARTLLDMAKSLDRRAAAFGERTNAHTQRRVIAAIRYLAYETPVDTSRALSNWQVSLDYPVEYGRQPFYTGAAGSTREASAQATIAFAEAILEQRKPGQTIYISNVMPYIRRLNEGSSTQSPGGFVEAAQAIIRMTK